MAFFAFCGNGGNQLAEGTATAELDTAPVEVETTELEAPESVLPEGTETDNGSEATTDSDEPTSEEEEPETLTKEAVDKLLKAERAKLEESYRQKTENAQKQAEDAANKAAFTQRVTESARLRHRSTYEALAAEIKGITARRENGEDVDIDADKLMAVGARQADAAYWDQDAAMHSAFLGWAARNGFRPTPEQNAPVERALFLPPSDPARIPQVWTARAELWEAGIRETLMPKLREEIEAEVRAELGAAGKTAAMKSNDAARAAQPKPTAVGTTGGPRSVSFKTQQQVDMALYKGEINTSTARQWLSKGLPYS